MQGTMVPIEEVTLIRVTRVVVMVEEVVLGEVSREGMMMASSNHSNRITCID
jgi:hypothetical protein